MNLHLLRERSIDEALELLPLRKLTLELGIQTEIPERDGTEFDCPFCGKKKFNFYDSGTRFHCYVCGRSGRGPDLISYYLNIPAREGIKRFLEIAEGDSGGRFRKPFDKQKYERLQARKEADEALRKAADREESFKIIRRGTDDELRALAKLRGWSFAGVSYAQEKNILRFGLHHGFPSWIITDESRLSAEARRLDGGYYPSPKKREGDKDLSLKGSDKSWPVGLAPLWLEGESMAAIEKVALVEGKPDLITAINYAVLTGRQRIILPIAMLGKGIRKLHPDSLPLLAGKHIDCFPHIDDEGGMAAWADKMTTAGRLTEFSFEGLKMADGEPVTDLNDTVYMDPVERAKINLI